MALYTVRSERICASSSTTISCSAGSSIWMRSSRASTIDLLAQPGAAFEHDVASEFFTRVVVQARTMQLLSDEHFTVYGTLVEAWASLKRFKRKERERSQSPDDTTPATRRLTSTTSAAATRLISRPPTEAKLAKKGAARKRSCVTGILHSIAVPLSASTLEEACRIASVDRASYEQKVCWSSGIAAGGG